MPLFLGNTSGIFSSVFLLHRSDRQNLLFKPGVILLIALTFKFGSLFNDVFNNYESFSSNNLAANWVRNEQLFPPLNACIILRFFTLLFILFVTGEFLLSQHCPFLKIELKRCSSTYIIKTTLKKQ